MATTCPQCSFQFGALVDRCPQCGTSLAAVSAQTWFAQQATAMPASTATTVAMRGIPEGVPLAPATSAPAVHNPQTTMALTRAQLGILAEQDSAGVVPSDLDGQSFDMRQLLDATTGGARLESARPVSQTMAFVPPGSALDETSVEGLEPVKLRGRRVVSATGRKRQLMSRSLPLVLVGSVALLAMAAAGYDIARNAAGDTVDGAAGPSVTLPAGEFTIGLTEENKDTVLSACYRLSDNPNHECRRAYLQDLGEYPSRQQAFGELRIDRDEVSNRAWAACEAAGACPSLPLRECRFYTHRGYQLNATVPDRMLMDEMPAICATRDEAEAYCRWVGGRLPTAAEWERAARSGDDRLSPWGELWAPHLMNWGEHDMGGFPVVGRLDGYDLTAPVDHFGDGETPDGIRNLFGNIAEWVAAEAGVEDGVRGGSYTEDLRDFRATFHNPMRPDQRRSNIGFRCVY